MCWTVERHLTYEYEKTSFTARRRRMCIFVVSINMPCNYAIKILTVRGSTMRWSLHFLVTRTHTYPGDTDIASEIDVHQILRRKKEQQKSIFEFQLEFIYIKFWRTVVYSLIQLRSNQRRTVWWRRIWLISQDNSIYYCGEWEFFPDQNRNPQESMNIPQFRIAQKQFVQRNRRKYWQLH